MEKGRNCSLGAISPSVHNILLPVPDFHVETGTKFLFRGKRSFEISVDHLYWRWLSLVMSLMVSYVVLFLSQGMSWISYGIELSQFLRIFLLTFVKKMPVVYDKL